MQDSVTVHVNAPAELVWGLVSDVTNTGRFSPETFEAEWLGGATGPAVGVKFRGHVKRNGKGPIYWTTCTIVASDPGREFAFTIGEGDKALNTWRYRFVPNGGGTDVTESFQLADKWPLRLYWALFGWSRGKTNHNGMQTTLDRLKAVAEGPEPLAER
ncbi:MAG: hypothetical protein JWL73_1343 [Actinomycetia bacterium]|nr:hypothetical protein [Actinomycetes bacterium]